MFFSIIIPVYNVERYLRECVDSILNQTFVDFELILVDDGSKDASGDICDSYATKDDRVKVIHKENGGQSTARNAGTEIATGKYVIYIDSDDFISDPDFLKDIHNKAQHDADIICYKFRKYFEKTQSFGECNFGFPTLNEYDTMADKIGYLVKTDSFYCAGWAKAVKLSLLKENGIDFKAGHVGGEDQDWYYKVLLNATSLTGIDKAYIAYRQREGSTSATVKIKNLVECIYVVDKWQRHIVESGLEDAYKTALLNSIAKLYCNMLICYANVREKEKKNYYKQIKELSFLMKYDLNPRTATFNKLRKLVGFDLTMLALKIICRVKR